MAEQESQLKTADQLEEQISKLQEEVARLKACQTRSIRKRSPRMLWGLPCMISRLGRIRKRRKVWSGSWCDRDRRLRVGNLRIWHCCTGCCDIRSALARCSLGGRGKWGTCVCVRNRGGCAIAFGVQAIGIVAFGVSAFGVFADGLVAIGVKTGFLTGLKTGFLTGL